MPISFLGSAATNAANGGNLTFTLTGLGNSSGGTATLQQDDVVFLVYAHTDPTDEAITPPTGWNELHEDFHDGGSFSSNVAIFWKAMGATPDTTVTITGIGGSQNASAGVCFALRGVNTTTPLDVAVTRDVNSASTAASPAAITPSSSGAWIMIACSGTATTTLDYTRPADLDSTTNLFRQAKQADNRDVVVGAGFKTNWTSGAFTPTVFGGGANAAGNAGIALSIAIRPAGPPPTPLTINATTTPSYSLLRPTGKLLARTVSGTATMGRVLSMARTIAPTVTPAISVVKQLARIISRTVTPSATVTAVRVTLATIDRTTTPTASMTYEEATELTLTGDYPDAEVGQAYSYTPVTGGGASPFTYTLFSGKLPDGLTLNSSTGAITGTPTGKPVNTVAPVISGTPEVGQTLTCTTGTWTESPTSYAYQWKEDGTNISGATSSTYVLQSAELGGSITCAVTATNSYGAAPTAGVSNSLGPVTSGSSTFTHFKVIFDQPSHDTNDWVVVAEAKLYDASLAEITGTWIGSTPYAGGNTYTNMNDGSMPTSWASNNFVRPIPVAATFQAGTAADYGKIAFAVNTPQEGPGEFRVYGSNTVTDNDPDSTTGWTHLHTVTYPGGTNAHGYVGATLKDFVP